MTECELSEAERAKRNSIAYFGGCPQCGQTDGFVNVGRSHWFVCHEHKIKWCIGSNLFSGWREQTEDQQRAIYDKHGIGEYREITCEEASRHPLVQQWARDLEQNSKQNDGAILVSDPVESPF